MIARFFRDMRIRSRLLASYTSIFIAATLFGGAFIYFQVKHTIESNIENELNNTTQTILNMVRTAADVSIKNHLRAVAEKNREIVETIHADYVSGRITEKNAKERARSVLFSQTIGMTGYIYCASSDGIAIEHPKKGVAGQSFLSHRFVQDQITRREGYLEYEWKNPGEVEKRPKALFMTYFEPWDWIISVSTYREEFRELINVEDFRESILSLRFGKTGYAYVFDTSGNMIIHPNLEGNFLDAEDIDGNPFVHEIIDIRSGKMTYSWKNPGEKTFRDKLVIFNHLPEYDWIVASSCYLDELYAPLTTVRNIIILTILASIGLILPTSLWISQSITRPIRLLMDRFHRGGAGDFSVRIPVRSDNEVGQLTRYFNEFMARLQQYNAHLKKEMHSHRKTAEALRESEEKYRTILKRIDEGYFEIDTDGAFVFTNESMNRILGYSGDTPAAGNLYDFTDRKNQVRILTALGKVRNTGRVNRAEDWELIRADGSMGSFEASISPITDKTGRLEGFRGVLRDVTERVRSERALRMSEEMFSKAFRCSPSGIFIASIGDGRLINVNDSFLNFTGRSLLEVIGKSILSLGFFRDKAEGRRLIGTLRRQEKITNREFEFVTASGVLRQGVISAESLMLWGEPCIFAVFEDHTETRRLEREIIDISEKERHKIGLDLHDDLCPQLIGIEVLSKILGNKIEAKGLAEASEMDRIRELIRQSIEKTRRLSRGLCPVNLSDHGFDSSLYELASYVEDVFKIQCRCHCEMEIPLDDNLAATHIYCIAHEAVHNAARHSGAKNIGLSLVTNRSGMLLTVSDDGSGIPEHPEKPGMGLKIMEYRASRINGFLDISTRKSGGTVVMLEIQSD